MIHLGKTQNNEKFTESMKFLFKIIRDTDITNKKLEK